MLALTLVIAPWLILTPAAQEKELTATVVKEDLRIQVELSGVFIAEDKEEIAMEPKEYKGDLIVTKIEPEGAAVKEGDVLMEFESDKLDRALEDARNEVTDAEVELKKADADHQASIIEKNSSESRLEKELLMAEKSLEGAQEKATMELAKKERSIEDARKSLEDGQVDYQQLIELYEERELHTKTETILIEREKRRVKNLERSLEDTIKEVAHYKKYEHGKDSEEKLLDVEKRRAELKKARIQNEADLAEKQAAVTKAQRVLEKAKTKVADLETDAKTLKVIAPRDGVLFYGTTESDLPAGLIRFGNTTNEMHVGGRVRTHDILMTVASMENLSIKMRVLENDIQHMKSGLPISVLPDAFPNLKIDGKLTKVDQIASREGFFSEVREFTVKGKYDGAYDQIRSGMNCRVTVHADNVPDAIQIPVVSVFEDAGEHYCFVKSGATNRRQKIKIGATNGKMVQITEGLKPEEIVYLYDPNRE